MFVRKERQHLQLSLNSAYLYAVTKDTATHNPAPLTYIYQHTLISYIQTPPPPSHTHVAIFPTYKTTNLVEHLLQVLFGVDPGGNGITEEDEVLHHSTRVHTDHVADPTERRVLLFVVTYVAQ